MERVGPNSATHGELSDVQFGAGFLRSRRRSSDRGIPRLSKRCQELGVQISFVPRLYEKATTETSFEYLGCLPLVVSHAGDPKGWQFGLNMRWTG